MLDLDQVLREAVERGASDIHIKVGSPPHIRLDGELVAGLGRAGAGRRHRAGRVRGDAQDPRRGVHRHRTRPTSPTRSNGVGRFRVNVFRQRGSVAMVLRHILPGIPPMEELGLPPVVRRLAEEKRGLVLVTGPTGSGKTTTLAAMIDHINETAGAPHRHDRGPDRGPAPRQEVDHQPARGRPGHDRLPRRAQARAAPGPRRHPHRRDARPRDGVGRAVGGGDRSPRLLHAAHDGRGRDDQPRHRLLPAVPAAAGAHVARRRAEGHRVAAARAAVRPRRPGAGDGGARLHRARLRQDRRLHPDARARGDHRRRRVLRDADVRPEPAAPLRRRCGVAPRRAVDRVEPARPPPQDGAVRARPRARGRATPGLALAHSAPSRRLRSPLGAIAATFAPSRLASARSSLRLGSIARSVPRLLGASRDPGVAGDNGGSCPSRRASRPCSRPTRRSSGSPGRSPTPATTATSSGAASATP